MIAHAGMDREKILIAKCDLRKIDETRQNWPFLRDRRIDAYGPLGARFLDEGVNANSASAPFLKKPLRKRVTPK